MIKVLEKIESKKELIQAIGMSLLLIITMQTFVFAGGELDAAVNFTTALLSIVFKVICFGGGGFLLIFGFIEIAITYVGNNPDAKNKAVMGLGAGILLIAIGVIAMVAVPVIVSYMFSY